MKNRHGVDVQPGQLWVMRDGMEARVVRIYPCARGHTVELEHKPVWGYSASHIALSSFMPKPRKMRGRAPKTNSLHPKGADKEKT